MLLINSRSLRRDPFAEMRRLHSEMDRWFSDVQRQSGPSTFPPINLWAGDEGVALTAEIPGVEPGDVDISVEGDVLKLAGERKPPSDENVSWHRRERAFGKFARTIQLPFRVDAEKVEARIQDGVLQILLQRPEADKPRKIAVKTS